MNLQAFLEKYYQQDEPIILACSAGPDSMFLLYKLLETSYAKNLVICYFNHKTRPKTDEEEAFLEALWSEKWFKVEVASCDFEKIMQLYPSKSFEELAREKRYAFFNAVMNIYKTDKVITAHHLDDKIETFMFNMLRGSKLSGLTNIKESHGWILRPLLWIEKSEILRYLDENKLEYKIDETNNDSIYSRNKIRNEILPKCEEINEKYRSNMSNLMNYFEELQVHIDSGVIDFLWNRDYFEIPDFNSLSSFLQKEVIRYIFYIENGKSTIWLSEWNINEIIRFINGKNNKTIKEIKLLSMRKDNKKIIFKNT